MDGDLEAVRSIFESDEPIIVRVRHARGRVTDDRLAWEDHTLDAEQLDLLAVEPDVPRSPGAYDEPQAERVYQLTELPGDTFEDIFGDAA